MNLDRQKYRVVGGKDFLMSEEFDYNEYLNAFVEMYNEQLNKIKNILNDAVSSLSANSIKIPDVSMPQISASQIDIELLGEKVKGGLSNVDTGAGEKIKGVFGAINTESIVKTSSAFNSISSVAEKLADMCNLFTDDFRNFLNDAGIRIRESLLFNLSVLGELEWCYLEIEELEDSDLLDLAPSYLKKYLDDNEHGSIKDIDKYVTKFFTRKIIDNITNRTILNLDTNDRQKLNQAMIDFRARRYLDCANLLASLIDSQNIKQELYDLNNGRYGGNPINVSQGWQAFFIVFRNDLSKYFDGKSFNGSGKKTTREKGFKEFIEEVKSDLSDYRTKIPIILLASCLIKFFDDSNWQSYPQKPEVINRHWLMHGMYDMADITKSDCIKLLLILNQLTNIYAKLRNGEL